jgi:hypothetical protein
VLQLLVDWSSDVIDWAVASGSVQMLEYLRSMCCAFSADTIFNVADVAAIAGALGGSVEILDYLVQQGLELGADTLTAMLNVAGASEQLAAAQWCRQRGAEWPARLVCDTPWEVLH